MEGLFSLPKLRQYRTKSVWRLCTVLPYIAKCQPEACSGRAGTGLHMQSKRFYWLKLQEHFFQDKAVKKLRRMPNGDTCVMIYLKMLLLSLSSSGELYFDGLEPDFHTELALTLDEDEELVRDTLEFLMRVHRLEQKSETVYYLPEVGAVTGSESASAERMRKARQKPADAKPQEPVQAPAEACDTETAHCDTSAAHCDVEKEIEKEIEKELEIEKETESDAEKELFPESQTVAAAVPETTTTTGSRKKGTAFSRPTLEEIRNYCMHRGSTVSAEQFYDYYEANGWNIGKHPMRDWKAALRTWERHEKPSCPDKPQPPLCENAEAIASFLDKLT